MMLYAKLQPSGLPSKPGEIQLWVMVKKETESHVCSVMQVREDSFGEGTLAFNDWITSDLTTCWQKHPGVIIINRTGSTLGLPDPQTPPYTSIRPPPVTYG